MPPTTTNGSGVMISVPEQEGELGAVVAGVDADRAGLGGARGETGERQQRRGTDERASRASLHRYTTRKRIGQTPTTKYQNTCAAANWLCDQPPLPQPQPGVREQPERGHRVQRVHPDDQVEEAPSVLEVSVRPWRISATHSAPWNSTKNAPSSSAMPSGRAALRWSRRKARCAANRNTPETSSAAVLTAVARRAGAAGPAAATSRDGVRDDREGADQAGEEHRLGADEEQHAEHAVRDDGAARGFGGEAKAGSGG